MERPMSYLYKVICISKHTVNATGYGKSHFWYGTGGSFQSYLLRNDG